MARKPCPRCAGRGYLGGYHPLMTTVVHMGQGAWLEIGPPPVKCGRCEGRGWVEVWDGYPEAQKGEGA